jgi:predicted  nucleic acid-binding Zn-ribbon protein
MTVVQQLYDLLAIDVEIDKCKQSIASIDETLADNRLLLGTQRVVEETQATLREQETVRKDLELVVDSYQDKGKQLETKLYGGTVSNPRELRDMQIGLNLLQEQQKQQEESLLLSLEGVEDTERRLGNLQSALEEIQAARQKQQEQLLGEKTNLEKDSSALNEKRQGLSSLVSTEQLRLYDSIRSIRQGQAVAKVDRGMCQGCRISLPTKIVQLARTSEKPVQCPSCSRILYTG